MTNPASIAAFKSKTTALIETLKLKPEVVVGLGISLAASYAIAAEITPPALRGMLDQAIIEANAGRDAASGRASK